MCDCGVGVAFRDGGQRGVGEAALRRHLRREARLADRRSPERETRVIARRRHVDAAVEKLCDRGPSLLPSAPYRGEGEGVWLPHVADNDATRASHSALHLGLHPSLLVRQDHRCKARRVGLCKGWWGGGKGRIRLLQGSGKACTTTQQQQQQQQQLHRTRTLGIKSCSASSM